MKSGEVSTKCLRKAVDVKLRRNRPCHLFEVRHAPCSGSRGRWTAGVPREASSALVIGDGVDDTLQAA